MIRNLDHINIRTARLQEMTEFYRRVLGLTLGPRPDFRFDGAWLYCHDAAVVHLVATKDELRNTQPRIEHFAFKGEDFQKAVDHLRREAVPFRVSPVPGYEMTQIHLSDVDGNHVEINFDGVYV